MLGGGGIKAAAKRTAFGDVSNTFNATRPSKDDSTIPTKSGLQVACKPIQAIQDKKSAAFLRPAQRPLSVSSLKGLLTGVTGVAASDSATRQIGAEVGAIGPTANTRKVLTKRNTTIFKDPLLDTVQEVTIEPASHYITHSSIAAPSQTALRPIPSLQPSATEVSTSQDPVKELQKPSSETVEVEVKKTAVDTTAGLGEPEKIEALKSDGIFIDEKGVLRVYEERFEDIQELERPVAIKPAKQSQPAPVNPEPHEMAATKQAAPPHTLQPTVSLYPQTAPSEPEEYWDEEEEENYDEEGYVTARSYRSKGENTTGGATTVLFPHANQKVKKEIAAAKELVEATRTAEEIEDECYDTSMVAEYGDEIFDYMKQLEVCSLFQFQILLANKLGQVKMLPNAHYMDNQHEIQWSMRAVLMDWLVQVHHRFNLLPETLFLCVNYIDRFLSCKVVSLGKLQLVGATAIFIAAKYEEINCPSVQEIVYMVDGGYTIDEILKAERFMLTMLQFELGWPGPMSFLRRISKADDYDLETRTLAKYFLEVTVMDERFIGSPPSFAAAGSHCLARLMLHKGQWVSDNIGQRKACNNIANKACRRPNTCIILTTPSHNSYRCWH